MEPGVLPGPGAESGQVLPANADRHGVLGSFSVNEDDRYDSRASIIGSVNPCFTT